MLLSKTLPFFLKGKRSFFLLFLQCLMTSVAVGQFQDDFSGDLSAWQGQVDSFTINANEQLQLDATTPGNSTIYTQVDFPDSLYWEVYFDMSFAPSNNNNLKIYLQADDSELIYADGYFLQMGENGAEDAINLFRQDGGIETLLGTATLGAVAASPEVRVRIERTIDGIWTVLADYTGGSNFNTEFVVTDDTYGSGNDLFFGFTPKYTSSNTDNFFFDDVVIAELLPDVEPPVLVSATPVSPSSIDILFSENLEEVSAENISNYVINNGIGMPVFAILDGGNEALVHLSLSQTLPNSDDYILTTNNIADLENNISGMQTATFSFFQPDEAEPFDVLINEIMADPTPSIGLPQVEYIELYNRSNKVIDLENYGFSNGATPKLLPSYILQPDSYVLVTDDENLDSLTAFGDVIVLGAFPALTNGGDEITLTDQFGDIIHFVNYNLDWYGDAEKEDGGYSLELISPLNICEGQNNWRGTNNPQGGTPGAPNSIFNPVPDNTSPELLRAYVSRDNPNQIKLYFGEIMDEATAENPDTYILDNGLQISNIFLNTPSRTRITLILTEDLEVGVDYLVKIKNDLTDCNGNAIGESDEAIVAVPEEITEQDIIINEILFNPDVGGVDYLELYNKTDKTFDLSELVLRNAVLLKDQLGNDSLDGTAVAIQTEYLFRPKSYVTLTPDPTDIQERYTVENPQWLLRQTLPALANEEGNIKITTGDLLETFYIDSVNYSADWHHPLLDNEDGVSLERINADAFSDDAGNWQSAAGTAGFGTPTAMNSQSPATIPEPTDEFFTLVNRTFSPDGDGYKDFVQINYQADQNGYVANVQIFDATGRVIKRLLNNELLGLEGTFKWDGSDEDGNKARIGIYILWIEVFLPDGGKMVEKKTVVVGGEF